MAYKLNFVSVRSSQTNLLPVIPRLNFQLVCQHFRHESSRVLDQLRLYANWSRPVPSFQATSLHGDTPSRSDSGTRYTHC